MQKKGLQKKVFSEQVREALMEAIFLGELKPGARLIENDLAEQYGVSQAPIREALKSLEAIGLVTIEPYKGTTVRDLGQESMHEYFVVRSILEGAAGRLAAEAITEEEISKLEDLLKQMIDAAEQNDYEKRGEINQLFHKTIIEASHNQLLINLCKNIRIGSWSKLTAKYTKMDSVAMAERHGKMISLLKAHDGDGMEKEIKAHIKASFDNFDKNLTKTEK